MIVFYDRSSAMDMPHNSREDQLPSDDLLIPYLHSSTVMRQELLRLFVTEKEEKLIHTVYVLNRTGHCHD